MKKLILAAALLAPFALAYNAEIIGNVESKCSITTDTQGVYGNPLASKLSTLPADGGVIPILLYDIITAGSYKAVIGYPTAFASSPDLSDIVTWTGSAVVGEVSDATMSAFETNKVEYNNITEFPLSVAGTAWFNVASSANYGYLTAFPAGQYVATVTAECVAI